MAYSTMKKLINNANLKYKNGSITAEKYEQYKADYTKKLNVFYAVGQLTEEEYTELMGLLIDTSVDEVA